MSSNWGGPKVSQDGGADTDESMLSTQLDGLTKLAEAASKRAKREIAAAAVGSARIYILIPPTHSLSSVNE